MASSPTPATRHKSTSCRYQSLPPCHTSDELPNPSEDEHTDVSADNSGATSEVGGDDYIPAVKASTSIPEKGHASRESTTASPQHGIPPNELQIDSDNAGNRSSTVGDDSLPNNEGTTSSPKTEKSKVPMSLNLDDSLDEPLIVHGHRILKAGPGQGGKYVSDVGGPSAIKKKKRSVASLVKTCLPSANVYREHRHLGGKGRILNEDDILQVTAKAESDGSMGRIGVLRRLDTRKS